MKKKITLALSVALISYSSFAYANGSYSGKLGNVVSSQTLEEQDRRDKAALEGMVAEKELSMEEVRKLLKEDLAKKEENKRLGIVAPAPVATVAPVVIDKPKEKTAADLKRERYEAYMKKRQEEASHGKADNDKKASKKGSKRMQASEDRRIRNLEKEQAVVDSVIQDYLKEDDAKPAVEKKKSWAEKRREKKRQANISPREKAKLESKQRKKAKEEAKAKAILDTYLKEKDAKEFGDVLEEAKSEKKKTKAQLLKEKREERLKKYKER